VLFALRSDAGCDGFAAWVMAASNWATATTRLTICAGEGLAGIGALCGIGVYGL